MTSLYLGANAKTQAICFALCFACGLAGGVFALLYTKKSRFFEKMLVDFFTTVVIGAGLICCVEFFMQGSPAPYGVAGYALGVFLPPFVLFRVRKHRKNDE